MEDDGLVFRKVVAKWFIRKNDESYGCELCSEINIPEDANNVKQRKGTGYTNIRSHLVSRHHGWKERYLSEENSETGNDKQCLSNYFNILVSAKARNVFGWMNFIVTKHLSFSIVDDKSFRNAVKFDPLCTNTLMKYLEFVADEVRSLIAVNISQRFGLIFDGWSDGYGSHLVAVFATFHDIKNKRKRFLLAIAPLLDETAFTAQNHIDFIIATLGSYNRSREAIEFIVCDNCSTNIKIAQDLGVPMVGCSSHRLKLEQYDGEIQ